MCIGNRKVHALRCMMCGMQAPEQSYLMPEIMINEMRKFPNHVTEYQPIPGEACSYQSVFFKKTNAKRNRRNRYISRKKPVAYIDEKRDFII